MLEKFTASYTIRNLITHGAWGHLEALQAWVTCLRPTLTSIEWSLHDSLYVVQLMLPCLWYDIPIAETSYGMLQCWLIYESW